MTKRTNKKGAGRPGKIKSEHSLQNFSARISAEAIEIAKAENHTALFVDEAIKEKNLKINAI